MDTFPRIRAVNIADDENYQKHMADLYAPMEEGLHDAQAPKKWLDTAKEITSGDRRRDYGHPLYNFIRIAIKQSVNYANKFKPGEFVTPLDFAHDMLDMKVARNINTYKDDNFIDAMGYSNAVQDMDTEMKRLGYEDGIQAFEKLSFGDMYAILQRMEE